MTNTRLLRKKIEDSGLKLSYIASQLGISGKALTMKIESRTEFKPSEIVKLCDLLHVKAAEERE